VWNEDEFPVEWKDSIIVPIDKKGDKTDCSNYRGDVTSVIYLQNAIQNLAVKVKSKFGGHSEDHQCGFRRNRSTTDHIFCIRQILEKKWEYSEAVHRLFMNFKKAYDSVRREILYNIIIESGIPIKLVRLIKMYLTETYSRVWVGNKLAVLLRIV